MVDARAVQIRLKEMDDRLKALRSIQEKGKDEFAADRTVQAATERHMQLAIQAAIDVALHISAEDFSKTPDDYGSSFTLLAESGVIGKRLAESLVKGTKLRNLLVHAYLDIDPERMWQNLEGLSDLEEFVGLVDEYIS